MDALTAMHDAAVQMIDTSIVRVHQQAPSAFVFEDIMAVEVTIEVEAIVGGGMD